MLSALCIYMPAIDRSLSGCRYVHKMVLDAAPFGTELVRTPDNIYVTYVHHVYHGWVYPVALL